MITAACLTAGLAAFGMSLLLPKRYTAECRILIEPPGGSDFRVTTAVTPVYLESLRTYELFASSDDLFLRAAERFGLRGGGKPLDRLKRDVLKIELPHNTKVLVIRATLGSANLAHDVALYVAMQTVQLSRDISSDADRHLSRAAADEVASAKARMDRATAAWAKAARRGSIDELKAALDGDIELRTRVARQYVSAVADVASEAGTQGANLRALQARRSALEEQLHAIQERVNEEQKSLALLSAEQDACEQERAAAAAQLKLAETHLSDIRSASGWRGERLSIIDRGAVPERPSSPDIPLNILAAVFGALVLCGIWILLAETRPWSSERGVPYERYAER